MEYKKIMIVVHVHDDIKVMSPVSVKFDSSKFEANSPPFCVGL